MLFGRDYLGADGYVMGDEAFMVKHFVEAVGGHGGAAGSSSQPGIFWLPVLKRTV